MLIIRRENRIPAEKTHLQKCLRRKVCREFREGQNLHNYYFADWLNASFAQPLVKVRCFVKDKQEPWARGRGVTGSYLIVRRSASLPRFDERFVNYGFNKIQYWDRLRVQQGAVGGEPALRGLSLLRVGHGLRDGRGASAVGEEGDGDA